MHKISSWLVYSKNTNFNSDSDLPRSHKAQGKEHTQSTNYFLVCFWFTQIAQGAGQRAYTEWKACTSSDKRNNWKKRCTIWKIFKKKCVIERYTFEFVLKWLYLAKMKTFSIETKKVSNWKQCSGHNRAVNLTQKWSQTIQTETSSLHAVPQVPNRDQQRERTFNSALISCSKIGFNHIGQTP